MPTNFAEFWESRVITNLTTSELAPWLEGIDELDAQPVVLGEGTLTEKNVIHIPTSDFEPDVLINNAVYPLALQEYTDDEVIISLDKYQTKVVTLSDDQTMGASYKKVDAATNATTKAILKKKYGKAIHAIAPAGNTADTPVMEVTGGPDATAIAGRLILTYEDFVAFKKLLDDNDVPVEGRRIVLCSDHWNDVLLDRKRFGDQFVNYKKGSVAPEVLGFKVYQYINNPYYTGTVQKAYGAAAVAGDYRASVFFLEQNIAKKTGNTKQYYADSSQDPENQTNRLSYRHYFIAVPKQAMYIGAIVSKDAA